MATLAFLMNYISEIYEIDISPKFKVYINDSSYCKLTSDIYTYKFYIEDNELLTLEEKEETEDIYLICKQLKNTLRKFIRIKKISKYDNPVDTDLYFNKLTFFPCYQTVSLICNNTIFQFRLSDLINMWVKSLKHTDGLFVKPLLFKNPYTNVAFKKHNLYNIFIAIQFSKYQLPHLIYLFIKDFCNIDIFTVNAFPILKDNAINTYIENGHTVELMENINNMMHEFKRNIGYIFFPENLSYIRKKRIVKHMKPILKNYLYGSYGCNPLKKREALSKAKISIKAFFDINPYEDFTLQHRPRIPSIPPPPPPEPVINRRRRLFEPSSNSPSISFSVPPPYETHGNEYIPITIQELLGDIATTMETPLPSTARRRPMVRPFSLQLSAFSPTIELPRTPPSNSNNDAPQTSEPTSTNPYALQLFR